jgi:hypothetical protein
LNAFEAGNGRAGGKHVQLHSNNKSHGPLMLIDNPWHATSRRRYRKSSIAVPQFLSSSDCKSSCKLNISTKNYIIMKDKLF